MDTSKIIKGAVSSGRYTVTAPIIKEDYGLCLQIEGVELPSTYEVDFSNSEHNGTSVTMIGNSDGVLIPHQFIDTGKDIFAFLYHVGEDFGRTVYKFRIPNKVRPDRTNEEPTPEEQSVIDQAIGALNDAVAQTAQDVIDADASAQAASADADRAEQAKEDAQTFSQRSANSAQASADYSSSAQASASASAQSASEAEAARQATTSLVAEAQGYADASAQSAQASAQSASQALSSAQSASASAQSASGYASNAQSSAQTASSKASEASQSATAAAASAASITTPDATLTQAGVAADAKATGDEISDLKSDLEHTNNGNGLLSLGNIILMSGGNNTSTKAVRTNAYISDDIVKIIAKENKFALILCAYDGNNNNAYVGHSYGNGTDLISTNSEGTHVYSIDMREWRAAYPNYKWRLSALSNPWREITLEEAYQYFSFVYLNIVSRDKFDEYKANDVLANSLFISMSANNEWYFETDDNLNIYVKAYPYLLVRGGQTASDSYTIQWSNIVTNLSQYIVTSPKGVINCLKVEGGKSLCLDIVGKTLVVKPISHQRYPYFADIIVNFNGRIIKGQIDAYIGWTNYKSITELQMKLADVAYVPDAMKTALTTINENATYNYPNMAKLLWISDVHWNNDCYAYLKYLADFGQYDALIISGDLNYYQFEQTLEATKTGMSELARLWNSYYRGKTIVLPIRGNHDGHVGYSDYTSEMFANAVIKPFHDCEDNGYYYYDLEKYRIRVVMLNSSDDAQSRKGFKSEEVAWFSSVINSVESGWNVISVSHHPIVEQLNTESSLAGNSSGIVSAINSFVANKQDCRYIAHLSGHTHRDMMDKISGVNYVSIIDSSTDQSDYSADIICINQTTQTVNLLRSGQGSDRQFTY